MIKEKLKQIKNSSRLLIKLYSFCLDLETWFLNEIISIIPFWIIRKSVYKLLGMKIGKYSRIGIHTKIIRPHKIIIGKNTIINEYCYLDGRGGLMIGDNSSISIFTKIISASHRANSTNFEYYEKKVIIGNRVWIGCNATILDGSILKEGCIIGAGTVIKNEIEAYSVYIGNPAKKIKNRNKLIDYTIYFKPFFR